jgi:hypothetical protein
VKKKNPYYLKTESLTLRKLGKAEEDGDVMSRVILRRLLLYQKMYSLLKRLQETQHTTTARGWDEVDALLLKIDRPDLFRKEAIQ